MRLYLFIAILGFLLSNSCKKSDSESKNPNQWNMSRVEGVSTGSVNQTISLTVFYPTSSGCDIFDKFEQNIQDKIVSITAYGHTETSPSCIQSATERSAIFSFNPNTTGSFKLNFINRDNSYFTHILTIK